MEPPYLKIINERTTNPELRKLLALDMQRQINMVPGTRPSDAARDAVRSLDRLGGVQYRIQFHKAREISNF